MAACVRLLASVALACAWVALAAASLAFCSYFDTCPGTAELMGNMLHSTGKLRGNSAGEGKTW